jgi:hypothetical protein
MESKEGNAPSSSGPKPDVIASILLAQKFSVDAGDDDSYTYD